MAPETVLVGFLFKKSRGCPTTAAFGHSLTLVQAVPFHPQILAIKAAGEAATVPVLTRWQRGLSTPGGPQTESKSLPLFDKRHTDTAHRREEGGPHLGGGRGGGGSSRLRAEAARVRPGRGRRTTPGSTRRRGRSPVPRRSVAEKGRRAAVRRENPCRPRRRLPPQASLPGPACRLRPQRTPVRQHLGWGPGRRHHLSPHRRRPGTGSPRCWEQRTGFSPTADPPLLRLLRHGLARLGLEARSTQQPGQSDDLCKRLQSLAEHGGGTWPRGRGPSGSASRRLLCLPDPIGAGRLLRRQYARFIRWI